jgi:hypothetical protein
MRILWTVPRKLSPLSRKPVFWITTAGVAPPIQSPAATAKASPSRVTEINRIAGSADTSCRSAADELSGNPTTWLTPHFLKAPTTTFAVSITAYSSDGPEEIFGHQVFTMVIRLKTSLIYVLGPLFLRVRPRVERFLFADGVLSNR